MPKPACWWRLHRVGRRQFFRRSDVDDKDATVTLCSPGKWASEKDESFSYGNLEWFNTLWRRAVEAEVAAGAVWVCHSRRAVEAEVAAGAAGDFPIRCFYRLSDRLSSKRPSFEVKDPTMCFADLRRQGVRSPRGGDWRQREVAVEQIRCHGTI